MSRVGGTTRVGLVDGINDPLVVLPLTDLQHQSGNIVNKELSLVGPLAGKHSQLPQSKLALAVGCSIPVLSTASELGLLLLGCAGGCPDDAVFVIYKLHRGLEQLSLTASVRVKHWCTAGSLRHWRLTNRTHQ
jgi:hypothetical protein